MHAFGFPELLLGLFTFVCVVWSFVTHILVWTPLFENVRDSCKESIAHPQRARLLWLVALSPAIWLLAVVIYFHNMLELWDLMTFALQRRVWGRFIYATLDVYFLLLVFCGIVGLGFSATFVYGNRQMLVDLVMIIRFSPTHYHRLADMEEQNASKDEPSERRISVEAPNRLKHPLGSGHSIYSYEVGRMIRVPPELCSEHFRRREERIATQDAKVRARMEEINSLVEASKNAQAEALAKSNDTTASDDYHGFDSKEDYLRSRVQEIKTHVNHILERAAEERAQSNPLTNFTTDGEESERPELCSLDFATQPERSTTPNNEYVNSGNYFLIDSDDEPIRPTPAPSASTPTMTYKTNKHYSLDFGEFYDVSDSEDCSSCCSTRTRSLRSTRRATHREPLTPTSPNALTGRYPSDANAELTGARRKRRFDPDKKRKSGNRIRKSKRYSSSFPTKARRCDEVDPPERTRSLCAELYQKPGPEDKFEGTDILARRRQWRAWLREARRKTNSIKAYNENALGTELNSPSTLRLLATYVQRSRSAQTNDRRLLQQKELPQPSAPCEQAYQAPIVTCSKTLPLGWHPQLKPVGEQPNQAEIAGNSPRPRCDGNDGLVDKDRCHGNIFPRLVRAVTPLTISIPPLTLPNRVVGASLSQMSVANPDPPTPNELGELWPQPEWYYSETANHRSGDDAN